MLITYVDLAKIKNVSKSAVSQRKSKGIFKQALVKTVDGKDFLDLNKQMLNFSFPLQDNVTIYLKNDLNDSFERTESVIGTSITF